MYMLNVLLDNVKMYLSNKSLFQFVSGTLLEDIVIY